MYLILFNEIFVMRINPILTKNSFSQTRDCQKENPHGIILSAVGASAAGLATPLVYCEGFKEYKNRNKAKFAAGVVGLGILSGLAKYCIDKNSDDKRNKYLNFALGISIIPLCLISDYHSAITKNLLKEKNQKFCKSFVNGIKKIFDNF